MLITDESGKRAVLGRAASWEAGRYSTLAGFVETGESLEDAVMREVKEEVDMHVEGIQYHASQPWPFPQSLMVGFTCVAPGTQNPAANADELEDAQWFSKDDVRDGKVKLPPKTSISNSLISTWLKKD